MRPGRAALAALTLASALIPVFCLVGGRTALVGFAILAVAFPPLLMTLGAAGERGRLGAIAWPLGLLFVALEAGLVGIIALSGRSDPESWVFGLPPATAIQLYGLFLVPLALVAIGFALTFARFDVSDADLERLRDLAKRRGDE